MKLAHVCLSVLQLVVVRSQCPQCAGTAMPQNTTTPVAMTTTEMAMEDNVNMTTTPVATTAVVTTTAMMTTDAPSAGPSGGPSSRLLMDAFDLMWDGHEDARLLTNASDDDNETATEGMSATTAPTSTVPADVCVCPPEVVSTFTATLVLGSAADLAALDFDELAAELADDFGDATVVVEPIVKIQLDYTLNVAITEAQCKAAVATAFDGVSEDNVQCGEGEGDGGSPDATTVTTTTTGAGRRLQSVTSVTISFSDKTAAATAATDSQNTTAFVDALAAGDDPVTVEATVSPATVTVELAFTVTGETAITEPTPASLATAVSDVAGLTVTVEISDFAVAATRQSCADSDICETASRHMLDGADMIGCAAEECTAAERDLCCAGPIATPGAAQGTRVLGSLWLLLLWNLFC